jgi:hypothetical protein
MGFKMRRIDTSSFEVSHQLYIIPTIKFTHDKLLHGYKSFEFIWWKWGIEISFK